MSDAESESKDASSLTHLQPLGSSFDKPDQPKYIVNCLLLFLSTASTETAAASLLGLAVLTYFILGRLGLLLIGIVVGVILHASWEIRDGSSSAYLKVKKRKQLKRTGLQILDATLQWRTEVNETQRQTLEEEQSNHKSSYDENNLVSLPKTSDAIKQFKSALLRNYIDDWYSPLYPQEPGFPNACRKVLDKTLSIITSRFIRRRPADILLDFITKSSSIFIVLLQELSLAFEEHSEGGPAEVVSSYIHRNPQSSLAHLLNEELQQQKLEVAAEGLLQSYIEPCAYAFEPTRYLLKSAFTISVLRTTLDTCAKASWINGWIIYLLQDSEPELISALDSGVGQSLSGKLKESQAQWENTADVPSNASREEEEREKDKKHLSPGQVIIDQAAEEVQRLNAMIAEDNAQKGLNSTSHEANKPDSNRSSSLGTAENFVAAHFNDTTYEGGTPQPPIKSEAPISMSSSLDNEQDSIQKAIGSSRFTDFTQLGPSYSATSAEDETDLSISQPTPFTLLNSKATVLLDIVLAEKSIIRSKPTADFFVQVEPASGRYPGWIVGRKYASFEALHEILRRISVISGLAFHATHNNLPSWKGKTSQDVSIELERYLNDALFLKPLAESEGMRRFFEKNDVHSRTGQGRTGFTLENVGKGMKDVFSKAPKEVAGGGKAFIGGMSGVFSGVGGLVPKRTTNDEISSNKFVTKSVSNVPQGKIKFQNDNTPEKSQGSADLSNIRTEEKNLTSEHEQITDDSRRKMFHQAFHYTKDAHFDQQTGEDLSRKDTLEHSNPHTVEHVAYSMLSDNDATDTYLGLPINLPPPPSDISENYNLNNISMSNQSKYSAESTKSSTNNDIASRTSVDVTKNSTPAKTQTKKTSTPLTINEAQIILELIFADINELYTLSSAWNFRKTLLNAAKTFLLRPGNLHMEKIRSLVQEKIIDANTSDEAIAYHIHTLRRNSVPTDEELESQPAHLNQEEQFAQRKEAKRLLVERGMPQALIGVMGAVASREALSKIFECLQLESVARGLMFGLLMQMMQILA